MPENNNILALYFDAPMQSWGCQSRFDRRDTIGFPTKSGVLGLLCAAMGIAKDDTESLEKLARLNMEVRVLAKPKILTDYQTVGGGYDKTLQRQNMPVNVDNQPSTVQTWREYLLEARFGVLLEGGSVLLEKCKNALINPKWGIWLGRKCAIPASFVFQGLFENKDLAVKHLEEISGKQTLRIIQEATSFEEGTDSLIDTPLDYKKREFTIRRIEIIDPVKGNAHADL
jgi:CRISPR system Cascade subunit CasD